LSILVLWDDNVVLLRNLDIAKDCSAFIIKQLSSFKTAECEPPPHSITSQKIWILVSCYLYCKRMSHSVVIFAVKLTDIKLFFWLAYSVQTCGFNRIEICPDTLCME
jgi:hypothetical protein